MKIAADRDTCIGAGMCVGTSDTVFDQDDGGIVLVVVEQPDGSDADLAREAVALCPSGALRIIE